MNSAILLKRASRALSLKEIDQALEANGEESKPRERGRRVTLPGNAFAILASVDGGIQIDLAGPKESASVLIDFAFNLAERTGGTLHKFANGPSIGRGTLREALVAEEESAKDPTDGSKIAYVCGGLVMAAPIVVFLLTGMISVWLCVICFGGGASIIRSGRRRYF